MPKFDKASLAKYTADLPAEPEKKSLGKAARSALYGGAAADAISTIMALKDSSNKEGNPLYGDHPSAMKIGLTKGLAALGSDFVLSKLANKHDKLAKGMAYGLGALQGGIAIHNSRQGK